MNRVYCRSNRKKKTVTNPSVTHFFFSFVCLGKELKTQKNWGQGRAFLFFSLDYFSTHYWSTRCFSSRRQCCLPDRSAAGLAVLNTEQEKKRRDYIAIPHGILTFRAPILSKHQHSHFSTFCRFSVPFICVFLFSTELCDDDARLVGMRRKRVCWARALSERQKKNKTEFSPSRYRQ